MALTQGWRLCKVEHLQTMSLCCACLASVLQGLVGLISNPVLANGVAGLATSATAQSTIQVLPMLPLCADEAYFCPGLCSIYRVHEEHGCPR